MNLYLIGTAKWTKKNEPDKYGKYSVCLYMNDSSWEAYKNSGLQLKEREDEDGKFIQFSRSHEKVWNNETVVLGPPKVLIRDDDKYVPFDEDIGNGSLVTLKINVYNTKRGPGHTLEVISVENLVPYESKKNISQDNIEMPF